jgi:hypothetical protein
MIKPLAVDVQSVFLVHLIERKIIRRPHAFVGECRRGKTDEKNSRQTA